MNIIVSILSGVFTAVLIIILKDYLEIRYFSNRNARRKFKLAVMSFILKSRLPEFSWETSDDEMVKKVIQLIHLKPIYKEFHYALINRPPHVKFKNPSLEKVKYLNCKSFNEAEKRTICHVSALLFDSGDFETNNIKPASYLFNEQDSIYDFPAKYWIEWLKENNIDYYKYKV